MSGAAGKARAISGPTPPNARTFGWLVLAAAAFIVYGSLVPFAFQDRPWGEAVAAFRAAMTDPPRLESRSDALANVMLGVPLGFGLLGLTCGDRRSRGRELAFGVLLLPLCAAFSAAVEFAQLYCPTRTCAASDVLMQAIGAALGMSAWVAAGQRLIEHARAVWAGPEIGGSAGRLLVAYLVLLAFLQALPLNLTLSPADLYRKVRDGHVRFVPFGEWFLTNGTEDHWGRLRESLEVVALYLPVGLLAGCLPGRFWYSSVNAGRILALAVLLGVGMEAIQLFVASRTPSATDATIGAATVLAGWLLVRRAREASAWSLGAIWVAVLLVANWQPFDFTWRTGRVEWLPLLPLEMRNPLFALQDLLTKLILFAPLGVAATHLSPPLSEGGQGGLKPFTRGRIASATGPARTPPPRGGEKKEDSVLCALLGVRNGTATAVVLGASVSLAIEMGQVFLSSHTPSVTDVFLGGVGAWVGALAAIRAMRSCESRGSRRFAEA